MSGWEIAELIILGIVVFDACLIGMLFLLYRWLLAHPYNPKPILNSIQTARIYKMPPATRSTSGRRTGGVNSDAEHSA